MVRLHDVLLAHFSESNNNVPSMGLPQYLKKVSNETSNNVSVVRYQDFSVVRIHNVPLVRPCDVSCKSQKKHQRCRCGLSPPYPQVTLLRRLIGRFILRFQIESIYFAITSVW